MRRRSRVALSLAVSSGVRRAYRMSLCTLYDQHDDTVDIGALKAIVMKLALSLVIFSHHEVQRDSLFPERCMIDSGTANVEMRLLR